MKKILKFLKCKDIEEVVSKIKCYEINEELEEFKELMIKITKGDLQKKDLTTISGKTELLNYLRGDISLKNTEEFKVLFLNSSNCIIKEETLFKGTVDRSVVYPRLIIEKALKYPTRAVIFAHNHPSGNLTPSKNDIKLTKELAELLDKLDIKVLDHIIITSNDYYSFHENMLLDY